MKYFIAECGVSCVIGSLTDKYPMPSKGKLIAMSSVDTIVLMSALLPLRRTMQVFWWGKPTFKSVYHIYSAYSCSYKIWIRLWSVCIMCFLGTCLCSLLQRNALCWSAELPVFLNVERKNIQNNKCGIKSILWKDWGKFLKIVSIVTGVQRFA